MPSPETERAVRAWFDSVDAHDLPATGRAFSVEGGGIWQCRDGKVSASVAYWRPDRMLEQLGVAPPRE